MERADTRAAARLRACVRDRNLSANRLLQVKLYFRSVHGCRIDCRRLARLVGRLKSSIELDIAATELETRRTAMTAKGKAAWQPAQPRERSVSAALQAYAALTTSAARGAVRDVSQLTK